MSTAHKLTLIPDHLAVCRLPADAPVPVWVQSEELYAIVRTPEELSIVCNEDAVKPNITAERGWRALKVQGPLDFSQIGVLASLATPLAEAGVSIFVISTFETDYVLVKEGSLDQALQALRQAGSIIRGG